MNGTVKEWVSKAETDYARAARELRATESPNYDAACFHAEQCADDIATRMLFKLRSLLWVSV